MKRRRKGRIILGIFGVLIVLVLVLIVLAPTLVSMGLGHGMIAEQIEKSVIGEVAFDEIDASWLGEQSISDLTITQPDGLQAVNLDATLKQGLLGLLFGAEQLEVVLSGVVKGDVREDGSISLMELVPPSDEPTTLPPGTTITLVLDEVDVLLDQAATGQTLAVTGLNGETVLGAGEELVIDIEGRINSGGKEGPFKVAGRSDGLFNPQGDMTFSGTTLAMEVLAKNFDVPVDEDHAAVEQAQLNIDSDDLTAQIHLTANMNAVLAGADTSTFEADFIADSILSADGAVAFAPEKLRGRASGTNVPTALLEPMLAATPISPGRDIGPVLDLQLNLPNQRDNRGGHAMQVEVQSERINTEIAAQFDQQDFSISGERFILNATLTPQLLTNLSGRNVEGETAVTLELSSFSIPGSTEAGTRDLRKIAAEGSLRIGGETPTKIALTKDRNIALGLISTQLAAVPLGDGLTLLGDAQVAGMNASFDQRLTNLFDEDGQFAASSIQPIGTLTVRNITPGGVIELPAETAMLVGEVLPPEGVTLSLQTQTDGDAMLGTISATGGEVNVNLGLRKQAEQITLRDATITLPLTPGILTALQMDSPEPISLVSATQATVALEPVTINIGKLEQGILPKEPIRGTLTANDFVVANLTGFVEPAEVAGLQTDFSLDSLNPVQITLDGVGELRRPQQNQTVAQLAYNGTAAMREKNPPAVELGIDLNNVHVARLEQMLGKAAGTYSQWTGDQGNLTANVSTKADTYQADLDFDLPRITGQMVATVADDLITLTSDSLQMTLAAETLQKRMNPSPPSHAPANRISQPTPTVRVAEDVTVTPTALTLRLPRAMFAENNPFDPGAVRIDIAMTTTPLTVVNARGIETRLKDISMQVETSNLSEGVRFVVDGGTPAAGESAGTMHVEGWLSNLVAADSTLRTDQMTIELDAEASNIPTGLLDALGNQGGLLVAALGPTLSGQINADDFSADSGVLSAEINTPTSSLNAPRIVAGDGVLRVLQENPISASLALSEPLRDRLLASIHPILGDIESLDHPIEARIIQAAIPTDGDVSNLNADARIEIGKVKLDSGSTLLLLLQLVDRNQYATIPAEFEPIVIHIREGIVTYERFLLKVDKYNLAYSGRVNLNTKQVNLRTEVPGEALAKTFKELQGVADEVTIPLVTTGTFGNLKTQPDLQGVLRGAIPGAIEKALDGKKLPSLFDDILNRDRSENDDDSKTKKNNGQKQQQ